MEPGIFAAVILLATSSLQAMTMLTELQSAGYALLR